MTQSGEPPEGAGGSGDEQRAGGPPPPPPGPVFNPQSAYPSGDPQGQQPWPPPVPPEYGQQAPYGYPPQQPYGQPGYAQPGYPAYGQQTWGQAYGGYPGVQDLPKATTALVLGIIGLAGTFFCVLPIVVSPFAWVIGARARREIRESQGRYTGESKATTGMVLGIIGTVLLALGLILVVVLIVVAINDPSFFDDTSTYDGSDV